ncbi:hypothetical protein BH23GEM11_BH23GEM11_13320 [soil metagenome]
MPLPVLHAWPLEGIPPLPLPAPDARRPWPGVGVVTGGGLVARVTTGGGLQEVARENPGHAPHPLALPPGFEPGAPAEVAPSVPAAFLVPGRWSRHPSHREEERGVVLDAFPVIVVQRLGAGTTPTVRSTHLLAPDAVSADTRRRLLAALPARVLRRHGRGEGEAGLDLGDSPGMGDVAAALRALDDAPLADPADEGPRLPALVGGSTGDRLLLVGPAQLVEVALGALAGGRWQLAGRVLDAVLEPGGIDAGPGSDAGATPAALLLLATRWATWTGQVERLRPHGEALDRAARSLGPGAGGGGDPDLPASFPSTAALLSDFADAVEPLGDRTWVEELRGLARGAETGREAVTRPAPDVRPVRGVRLPVIGSAPDPAAPESDDRPAPRPASAHLPPVQAFASPHHPSVAPRRTVHSARLVRSAVEGLCGVQPDAAWGRVTLAPDLRGLPADEAGVRHLVARGIRVGDVRIDLDCRVSRMGGTLRVSQVAGRVPTNVVFEPLLPLAEVGGVRLGGSGEPDEDADVEIEVLEDGVRLRFQFPLDPERRVSVDGAP